MTARQASASGAGLAGSASSVLASATADVPSAVSCTEPSTQAYRVRAAPTNGFQEYAI